MGRGDRVVAGQLGATDAVAGAGALKSVAGTSVAGTWLAGSWVAGISVVGTSVPGTFVVGMSPGAMGLPVALLNGAPQFIAP